MQVMKGNKVIVRWRMLENKTMNISRTQTQTYLKCSFASWNWSWPNCMKPACCRIRLCKICASRKGQKMRKSCLSLEKNTNDQVNQLSFTFYIKVQLSLLYHKTSIFIWPLTQMLHISHKKPKKTRCLLPGTSLWEYFSVLPLWGWAPPPLCDLPVGPGSVSQVAVVPGYTLP